MQHAKNRALREEVYRAYLSRASSGDLDNTAIIDQILKLRLEKAKLLGYSNYAEVSMATKMATVEKADELLEKLRSASWAPAVQDIEDLKSFAKKQGAAEADSLTHWDVTFWSERLRESKYDINEEELRPYFSLPKVMDGLFSLAKTLFGIDVVPADGVAPVWNSDVRFYCVKDSSGNPTAYFYFDPYSRPSEKRGGAWMDEVFSRSRVMAQKGSSVRLPVAQMVCNQTPPVGDKPSLMTFREVETVFHEFGHALQHMLTKEDEGLVAGIRNIEWDAVELPSQFMENWCYHRDTLMSIAKHYQTGETLPEDAYKKLLAARTFRAGSLSLRQLKFATVDLELHTKYVPGGTESIYDVDQRVSVKTQVIPPLPEDRFLCSFSHIFAGGYAAGYYSYKWAEVLSADAFSAFEDAGLDDIKAVKETGQRFRNTILALGGGKAPLQRTRAFPRASPQTQRALGCFCLKLVFPLGNENATADTGPWLITLDAPSYLPVMQHAKNRALREEVYRAYLSRASSGDLDNTAIIDQILKLRLEKAKLLGYSNYAEVSMATKMATVEKADELLEKLRSASWAPAVQDIEDLKSFAKNQGAAEADSLTHWDITFWSERLRESKYDINEEELRPYFSLPKVMDGLFRLAKTLFGVDVVPADGVAPVWNSDVRFYCVKDSSGTPTAYFYFDPYSRPSEKRGGAWMDEVFSRSRVMAQKGSSVRLPVAQMVCNQTPPVGDKPSLMTFREVETVFHEFGHALQHMLTKEDEGLVAGIRNIEWDAVELPSQFMENWCYHRDTLMSIAKHYQTGETLPEDVYKKLLAARTFRAGSLSLRQLKFATVDLELHTKYVPGGTESIYDVDQRVSIKTQVIPPLPEDRFLCSFSHIFAGGYAAGYYSYKWAEVLSADAFSAFEDAGLDDIKAVKETGQRFRNTILALGGGKAPLQVFVAFRGREPSPEPLLRHNGLLAASA
ncbi:hypothetical protein F2Q68_00007219 [Brassica cretica]|uniref:oligopeptidase A n=1 Tax=Brassica cretica TaxID=69181 RepID=A0A8S9L6L2_BRACR|nr:hypothetical protein F2Q68_00007219 [Brassica cretica]